MSESQTQQARRMTGRCAVCGDRIQRVTATKWRHNRPNPDGSPRDHAPEVV